jgi:hypothetical protein
LTAVRTNKKESKLVPGTAKTYTFTLVLSGFTEVTDDIANALYEAGCDDAGVGSCDGDLTVDFDREAESLGSAVGSAIADVERAGFSVARVEVEAPDH